MHKNAHLFEQPAGSNNCMIVGWRQWADAGSISSGLPDYLINKTGARKIGEITPDGLYLFQFPGTHHYLRPEIRLKDGYCEGLSVRRNELFFTEQNGQGLVIFLGDEPHLNVEAYGEAFFDLVAALNVQRVAAVGGVYGAMPYQKDREISCAYSLKSMQRELARYAVRFSNYEGGATIGSYLLPQAEQRGVEFFIFYGFVPAYDLSQISNSLQSMRIENDYKAWYDLLRRFNHMFGLNLDLADLAQQSEELAQSMAEKIDALEEKMPQFKIKEHVQSLADRFTEQPFMPLDDVWDELGDILDDLGN